ncbi:LamG-like jellyroll fold domain-containing protein, partial [Flavobacterium sp.]|uniref:LamG-like jellyroll fold domain-containing protein n=1 Tax=Flavobacterium sp. TaxID=239 RepID=UPI002635B2DA
MKKRLPHFFSKSYYLRLLLFVLVSFQFVHSQAPIFNSGMSITSIGSVSSPAGEEVFRIIDGSVATKFLDFNINDGFGFTVFIGTPKIATSIAISTANDASGRDPINYQILGSNNGSTFTSVATGTLACVGTRFFTRTFTFSNTVAYTYYRVNFIGTCGENILQLSEVQLFNICPLAISTQPQSSTVCSGSAASLSVSATGTGLTYQWYRNGTIISGATQSTLSLTNLTVSANYYCVVTSSCGAVLNSNTVSVNVTALPTAPTGTAVQTVSNTATLANLNVTGTGIKWYATPSGGASLPLSTPIVSTTTYYASRTVSGCEGTSRLGVTANILASGLQFDGVNDYVAINAPASIPVGNSSYTIEAKIKTTVLGSRGIVGWGNYGQVNQVNALRLDASGLLVNYWWANDLIANPSPTNLADGNWHHVVATYDGTTRKIYIDGILKAQDVPGVNNIPNASNMQIGSTCPTSCGGEYFNGGLDEVRIWNRALCQTEIQNKMNCELGSGQTGLVLYHKYNSGTINANNAAITTIADSSGANNTGVLTGFALTGSTSNWAQGAVATGVACTYNSLTATTTSTNVSCFGGSNGTATVTASGGNGVYTYLWSPFGGTSATATGLPAGTYTCTITSDSCPITSTVTILQPSPLLVIPSSKTNVACNGGSNGAASVLVSGGTSGYTYSWSPSGGTNATATGLSAGTYVCLVTDANNCSASTIFTITEPAMPLVILSSTQTNVSCNGGSNGSASVSVIGGTPGYTYSWLPSGGTGATATGLTAGTYTCIVIDANGCSTSTNFTITQPDALIVSPLGQTNVTCNGGTNGSASVSVIGGTPGYTYTWFPSGGTAATASGLSAGTYICSVADANGCTSTQLFIITEPEILVNSATQTSCDSYLWSVTGLTYTTSGIYTGTTTNVNGCIVNETLNLTINNSSTSSETITACNTYTWPENGVTYTSSGVYTNTTTNASGCPNVATLNLTIQNSTTYYADADNDGFGNPAMSVQSCTGAPMGYVSLGTDCNDTNAAINPNAVDVCYDGIDNDCNGVIDNVGLPGGCTPIVGSLPAGTCGTTLAGWYSTVTANWTNFAQGYRF